jgi:O-antigen ligase
MLMVMLVSFCIYPVRGTLLNYISGETIAGRAIWNGIYSNPNDLAGLSLLQFAFALGVLTVERQRWAKAIAWTAVLLEPLIIILTQSRGAFIALLLFGLIVGGRYMRHLRKVTVFAVCVAALLVVVPNNVWTRIGTFGGPSQVNGQPQAEAESSSEQRLEILRVATAIIAANPITGVGVGAYGDAHAVYAQSPKFNSIAQGHRDTHNTYLNLLAETGFVGFACFAILVVATLREARNARLSSKESNPALTAQLFFMEVGAYAYLIAGIWGTYGELIFTYFYFAVLYATARLLASGSMQGTPPRRRAFGGLRSVRARVHPREAAG